MPYIQDRSVSVAAQAALGLVFGAMSVGCAGPGRGPGPSPGGAPGGGAPDRVTVEWVYGPECRAVAAVPSYAWRPDGKAILLDGRVPAEQRSFELYDPTTQTRTRLLDSAAALASLRGLLGDRAPSRLTWPSGFDVPGQRGLYEFAGDLFVLDIATARFRRLTRTEAVEKSASFSPDGETVAYVRDNDLWVVNVESARETRLTRDGSDTVLNGTLTWLYWEEIFGRLDVGYWWCPDSGALAFLRTDESSVSEVHFTDFRPAVPRVIKQRYPKAGTANPDVRVGVVELDDGGVTWVDLDEAEYEYVARVQWLPGGDRLSVQTMPRDQRSLMLHLVDRETGAPKPILEERDEGWVNIHDDLYFLKDGEHFLWVSERDGYSHLYLYRLDGTLVRQVTRGDWTLRSSGGGVFWLRQTVAAIDEARGWIYFTALKKSSVEGHLYRVRFDGTGMERLSAEDGTHAVGFGPDARYYFDTYSNISTLPELRLHDAGGKIVQRLAKPRPELLDRFGMRYPELLTIPASDGFGMPAQLLRPASMEPGRRYPVIVHIYAGPSAPTVKNAWQHANYFDQVLLRNGYLVCKVDNRSATAISKKLENTVVGQLCGDSELNDLTDAARWLKRQPFVDPDRIGVWGWSGGGSTTLLLMTRSQEFRAGIAVAPVTDWHYYDTKWAEFAMRLPTDNAAGYRHTSLVARARDLHGRLLLVHGTYDDNVHPQNAWHFVHELVAAGKPFDMMFYPMRKHGIADRAARVHLFNKMVEFWTAHL